MVLRPLLLARLAPAALVLSLAVWGAASVGRSDWLTAAALLLLLVPAGYLLRRTYGLKVVCTDDSIAIHGYFRTTRIPRAAIVGLKGRSWPRLTWRTVDGRQASTLVTALTAASIQAPLVAAHNERCLDRLAQWIDPTEA